MNIFRQDSVRFYVLASTFLFTACMITQAKSHEEPKQPQGVSIVDSEEPRMVGAKPQSSGTTAIRPAQSRPEPVRAVAGTSQKPQMTVAAAAKAPAQKSAVSPAARLTPAATSSAGSGSRASGALQVQTARKMSDKVIRYVTAEILNVRSAPRRDAPVVGKLMRGTMFHVSVDGEWARIGDEQYVQLRYLSSDVPATRAGSRWTMRR